ncbi:MAG: hypothetical protein WAW11_02570 [Patescibacteria group bacterium]
MFITKKQVASFIFVLILGVLQLSSLFAIRPAQADESLLSQQPLLKQVGDRTYGANQKDVQLLAVDIIKVALTFLGIIFLGLLLFAGFKWMTSGGNEKTIEDSIGQIKAAVIGLLLVLAAWGITTYVVKLLICVTTASGTVCKFK